MDNLIDHDVMLSTSDNPYNPFTHYDDWLAYDTQMGYYTPQYLARVAIISDEISDYDMSLAIVEAIDHIVSLNLLGIYIKVYKKDSVE